MSRTEKKLPPTPPPRPTAYAPKQIADECETPGQVLTSSPVVARSDRDKSTSAAPTVQQLVPSTTTPDGSIQTVTQAELEQRLTRERERFEASLAAERIRYERMLQELRVEFQSQMESLRAALSSAASKPDRSMSGLIAKLFADRPAEKRDAWIKCLEEQEILTIDAASQLKPEGWDRLNLPIGVTETLKDAVRPPPPPVAPTALSALHTHEFPQFS